MDMFKPAYYITFSVLIFIPNSYAAVYKWVDEQGRINYGDKPSTEKAEVVEIKNSTPSDDALEDRMEKHQRFLDILTDERKEKETQKEQNRKKEQVRKKNCAKAKKSLAEMRDANFLYEDTKDPLNPKILSNKERTRELQKAEKKVSHWCN